MKNASALNDYVSTHSKTTIVGPTVETSSMDEIGENVHELMNYDDDGDDDDVDDGYGSDGYDVYDGRRCAGGNETPIRLSLHSST